MGLEAIPPCKTFAEQNESVNKKYSGGRKQEAED